MPPRHASSGGSGGGPISFFLVLLTILAFAWFASFQDKGNTGNPATGPKTASKTVPSDNAKIGQELNKVAEDLNKAQALSERSPAADYVSLSDGNAGYATNASAEYVSFTVSKKAPAKILITGWKLKSPVTGASVAIPQGIVLPFSGQVISKENIFASPGDRVFIVTGRSPTGYSFRLNKCTGYFEQFQNFTPSLPLECPYANAGPLPQPPNHLNDACLDYLDSISRCIVPVNNIPPGLSPECSRYVSEKISYGGCVSVHKNDPDFYKKEWRVYLDRDTELWKDRREVIKLLDLNGKTVGAVSY